MKQLLGGVLGGCLGVGTFVGYSAGFFNEIKIEKARMDSANIVYFEHEGDREKLGGVFKKLVSDCSPFMKIGNIYVISYDNPYLIKDVAQSRAIVG